MSGSLPPVGFIRSTVGSPGGSNHTDDVLWVQGLLNRWLKANTKPVLSLDGSFGTGTRVALVEFQQHVVKIAKPTGIVMPGDATVLKLLALRPPGLGRVVAGKNFETFLDGVSLDKTLVARVHRLSQFLIDAGLATGNVTFKQGVRSPKVAHRWSTSWNIRKGRVPLEALLALKGGNDLDGNLWYDKAWENGLAKDAKGTLTTVGLKALWKKVNANAWTFFQSDAIAAEGYALSDPRIKPNAHRAVSNHTEGRAIDASIPWQSGARVFGSALTNGENTDTVANRTVRTFDLVRPVASERWHFQLPIDASKGFVPKNNLAAGSQAEPPE